MSKDILLSDYDWCGVNTWLTGITIEKSSDIGKIACSIVGVNDRFSHHILCFVEEHFDRVGFLSSVHVDRSERGRGVGSRLLDMFVEKTKDCELVFLFARVSNPQAQGFCLQSFYESKGFRAIDEVDGELLMVSEGQVNLFRNEFA